MPVSEVGVPVDPIISRLAARQHGIVARRQLLAAGVTGHAVRHRLRQGRLTVVHRGVYRVGPVCAPLGRQSAALLACGPDAVLGFVTAGAMWGLVDGPPPRRPVDVIVPPTVRAIRRGVRVHRVVGVQVGERTTRDGLSLTGPARSLIDLANMLSSRALEKALARGFREGTVQRSRLERLVGRHSARPGVHRLRDLLAQGEPAMTRSEAEELFLRLLRDGDLTGFRTNARVERYEVDVLWSRERLIAEVDGRAYHTGPSAFEGDRERDAVLAAAGYTVVRVTYKQLKHEPRAVLARVARALGAAAG